MTKLWAVEIQGMDDLVPVTDFEHAVRAAQTFNSHWQLHRMLNPQQENDPIIWAVPVQYEDDIERHKRRVSNPVPAYAHLVNATAPVPIDPDKHKLGGWMQTFSGLQFWPLDPRPGYIEIVDIAHALSMKCRYGGHCRRFYSVAEHSVHLARYFRRIGATPDYQLWALMHDAAEAYLVDMPRPVKPYLPDYALAENQLMNHIARHFAMLPLTEPTSVKAADRAITSDEAAQNMSPPPVAWDDPATPLGITLAYWDPQTAEANFLAEFRRIIDARAAMRRPDATDAVPATAQQPANDDDGPGRQEAIDAWQRRTAASAESFENYYARQVHWSQETFGPGQRTKGIIDHIRKELLEVEAQPHDLSEWVDVIILAMDGFWRHGGSPAELMPHLLAKQQKNMARTWPDWRGQSEDQAIEHDRSSTQERDQ